MSDDRHIVYKEADGTIVYRASSVGKPLRCLSAARQGYDPLPAPEYLLKAAAAGTAIEPVVKARMRSEGWRVSGEQNEVEVVVEPGVIIRGHLDAVHCFAPGSDDDHGLEVKSMSRRVWDKWQSGRFDNFPSYAAQLTTYMAALNFRPFWYAVICRDDPDLFEVVEVTDPPADWDAIKRKVSLSERFAQLGILPVCDEPSEYSCPYEFLCDHRDILFAELESGSDDVLLRAVEAYDAARRMRDEVAARLQVARDEVLEVLGDRDAAAVAGWSVKHSDVTSRRLDTKKLHAELGERLNEFYTESVSKRLTVTPLKAGN